jgi:hypothetical protein
MKRLIIAGILCFTAVCASAMEDKKADKPAAAPKTVTIPKDAVRNANGSYTYTDKDGKKWLYRESPFGVIKSAVQDDADSPKATAAPHTAASATRAIDKGDTVQFERASPFGTIKWEKKKSELTDEERKIVEEQKPDTK